MHAFDGVPEGVYVLLAPLAGVGGIVHRNPSDHQAVSHQGPKHLRSHAVEFDQLVRRGGFRVRAVFLHQRPALLFEEPDGQQGALVDGAVVADGPHAGCNRLCGHPVDVETLARQIEAQGRPTRGGDREQILQDGPKGHEIHLPEDLAVRRAGFE